MTRKHDIYKKVLDIIERAGSADPFIIAEKMDIKVIFKPLPLMIRGMVVHPYKDNFVVIINNRINPDEHRIILAHELGHIFLGHVPLPGIATDAINKENMNAEHTASIFAMCLLLYFNNVLKKTGICGIDIKHSFLNSHDAYLLLKSNIGR